jgi:pyruvate kinase
MKGKICVLLFSFAALGTNAQAKAKPRPQIIATLGPSTSSVRTLRGLINAGMSMARINLSHSNARATRKSVSLLRQAERNSGRRVPLLCDLPGGKVRTGMSPVPLVLRARQSFDLLLSNDARTTAHSTTVDYRQLDSHVEKGDRIQLDDGRLELRVNRVTTDGISTTVVRGGLLRNRTGVHVVGKELPFPPLTRRDRRKLKIAVENGSDFVGVSFVQDARNVRAVKRALRRLGAEKVKVVAKIESLSGMANLDAIIDVADVIMIARGDLSLAVGRGGLAEAQAQIANKCRSRGTPFIVATGLMSAMTEQPKPSKANRSDVQRTIGQGPGWLMLNETAIGRYPVDTVSALAQLLR